MKIKKKSETKSSIADRGKRKGYKICTWVKEDHRQPLFGVSFNPFNNPEDPPVFATVGSNRVTLYECVDGSLNIIQCYTDPDPEENFYTVCWLYSTDNATGEISPLLAVAGNRGLIRIMSPVKLCNLHTIIGCGDSINELKLHPIDHSLLLSASKDNSLRLWNVVTRTCILVMGGLQGHRDEVLSCDFDLHGKYVLSCSMDHSVKMWAIDTPEVVAKIAESYAYKVNSKPFPVLNVHYPVFSTRSIHRNYVDCVRWFGNFILSKSCENKIVCWQPKLVTAKPSSIPEQSEVMHNFEYSNCDIWYMRFAVCPSYESIAAGNQAGKIFVWDVRTEPSKPIALFHQKCSTAIRQVCFSPDSSILIAVSDDSTIWRWDRTQ